NINDIFRKNGIISGKDAQKISHFLKNVNNVIDIIDPNVEELPSDIILLIKEREKAREEKNFKKADEIRNNLASAKIFLEDTPYGTRWIRK
ncbi:MAG TPA: cysteine--tRNA ligase, partial [bacterium]|nr:cysteine--tRNA ligase [bacterium]